MALDARRGVVLVVAIYIVVGWWTDAQFQGDSIDYIDSVEAWLRGSTYEFWEFGHLLWRPLGAGLARPLAPLLELAGVADTRSQIAWVLLGVSWIAGLAAALALYALVARPFGAVAATLVSAGFVVSQGVLNFSQSGTSYVPGLACCTGALALLRTGDREAEVASRGVTAGILLAGAFGFWAPYVLAFPGILLAGLVGRGDLRPRNFSLTVIAALTVAAVSIALVGTATTALRLSSTAEMLEWITGSSHGISNVGGRQPGGFRTGSLSYQHGQRWFGVQALPAGRRVSPRRMAGTHGHRPVQAGRGIRGVCRAGGGLWSVPRGRAMLTLLAVSAAPIVGFGILWRTPRAPGCLDASGPALLGVQAPPVRDQRCPDPFEGVRTHHDQRGGYASMASGVRRARPAGVAVGR
jgi:hypothetical protein